MKNKKIMAAILAATLTFGAVAFSACKDDEKDAAQTPMTESVQVANDNMTLTEQGGSGIQMLSVRIDTSEYANYGVSENAESAHLVTASYPEGEYVSNTAVDWSVDFVKADSAWATGKKATDYVTVTPTSDGALTAVVECKQAFGGQIRVVCASRQSPEKSDSFVCDYMSIVEKVDLNFKASNGYFVFSDVSLGIGYTSIYAGSEEKIIDLNAKDIVGQYNNSGFTTLTRTTGTTCTAIYSNEFTTVFFEYEEEYRSLISQSDILSFQVTKSEMWYGYLGLPGIDRLKDNQIYSILYYWELNHGGDVSNEKLAEYDDGGAAYYEYLRIMNELAALSNDTVTYTIRFDTRQTYKGESVYLDLVFKVTDASEYFKAEATSLTLDTDHILFEP